MKVLERVILVVFISAVVIIGLSYMVNVLRRRQGKL